MSLARYPSVEAMVAALTPSYPVYCLRPAALARQARWFLRRFPGRVLYAVKCNPHPFVLATLYEAGIRHFDTASLPEVAQIHEQFDDANAYYHHPVKGRAAIRSAYQVYGVRHYTIDSARELAKVMAETGGRDLAIQVRLATPAGHAAIDLSRNFGAEVSEGAALLRAVHGAGFEAGLSFHVGSQCVAPEAYRTALRLVGETAREAGVPLRAVNVGGGFPAYYPGSEIPPLADFVAAITAGAAELGLAHETVLMCEPGRALVADGCSILTQIHLRKDRSLYINEGVFGALSDLKLGVILPVRLIRLSGPVAPERAEFSLFGPTCDSMDAVPGLWRLPANAEEGDWIEFGQAGAYSNALATRFNGFSADTFVAIDDGAYPSRQ